jgi:hypothetical protein
VIEVDEEGFRSRFIIGNRPTQKNRKGEWGAALSILEGLIPLPQNCRVLLSGDAGFCVEEFCSWISSHAGLYYFFRIKSNAGWIYDKIVSCAESVRKSIPEGDYYEDVRISGSQIHSRRMWVMGGLKDSLYPGIREGIVIEKNNLDSGKKELQYFICSYPDNLWSCSERLERALLHWDTETGIFGVKDITFNEDRVRYKTIEGANSHVTLLNIANNCLYAPVFRNFWGNNAPLSNRIRFCIDKPEMIPLLE